MATINIGNLSFTHKGDYDGSTAYVKNDIVYYATNGNSYIAKGSTTGNVPTSTAHWDLFVAGASGIWNAGLSLGSAGQAVKVNAAGNALEFGAVAGGKIGQVLQTVKTSTFSHTFGSGHSFTNITGLSQAITPVATSSKVLIMVGVNAFSDDGSQATIDTLRDSTQIFVGDTASNKISATAMANLNAGTSDWSISNIHYTFLDSPNTTSATTYQVRLGGFSSGTHHINRSERDTAGTSYDNRLASSITLMEVLA